MIAILLAGLLSLATSAPAGAAPASGGEQRVFDTHPLADVGIMAASAIVMTVPTLLAPEIIRDRCPCDPAEVNSFDRGAIGNHDDVSDVVSSVTVGLAVLVPPAVDWLLLGSGAPFYADLTVFAEALLVNGALVEIAKYAVQRPLPRTYAGDPKLIDEPGGYRSFYSGHTSTAFAALMAAAFTIRQRYGEQWWPWIAAVAVGTSVGIERVAAGRHFPSDVIVGAAMGTAVGIGIPALHVARRNVTVLPARRGVGLAVAF